MPNPFGIGDLSSLGLPGANPLQATGVFDAMELVRKTWSSFALPPAMAPTIDPEEIERRIAELRAVEQWLVMNLTMLRGTIQALEIQRSTLATMQAFGVSSRAAMSAAMGEGRAAAAPAASAGMPASGWPLPQRQSPSHPPASERPPTGAFAPPAQSASAASSAPTAAASSAPKAAASSAPAATAGAAMPAAEGGAPGQPVLNPVAWWEMLQKQFAQVASAALANMQSAGLAGVNPAGSAAGAAGTAGTPSQRSPDARASDASPSSGGVAGLRPSSAPGEDPAHDSERDTRSHGRRSSDNPAGAAHPGTTGTGRSSGHRKPVS